MNETPQTPPQEEQAQRIRVYMPKRKPVLTFILMGISILVYIEQYITEAKYGVDLPMYWGMKFKPFIVKGGQWWRLFTPIFLHGSLTHIAFNMYSLFILGPEIEQNWGHLDFLMFYFICGLGGNALSCTLSPNAFSVGASTAIFGLVAARVFFILKNKHILSNPKGALMNNLSVIAVNLLLGMRGNIDNWGHIGGLLAGAIISFAAGPRMEVGLNIEREQLELHDVADQRTRWFIFILTAIFFTLLVYCLP